MICKDCIPHPSLPTGERQRGASLPPRRDNVISVCKALGIILMVVGHSECPGALCAFIYEFHMPLFFITAGYFFSLRYLDDEAAFVKKRLKGLYVPFVKWSVVFLLLHNLMFDLGVMNEQYGNAGGGVTHPYTWHQIQQNLWNILTAMGGYDQFLNGAFWFFRGLLVASVGYLVVFKLYDLLARKVGRPEWRQVAIPLAVCATALALGAWKTAEGLKVTTLVQGGTREITGLFFFGCGFLFRQLRHKYKVEWWSTLAFACVTLAFSHYAPSGMDWNAAFDKFAKLPLPAICGFLMVYNVSTWIDRRDGIVRRFLVFCGNNTLPVFVFHIISFKLVSLLKIWYYGLDPRQIGCHMVIHEHSKDDLFWILYTIAGVGIPIAWTYAARKIRLSMRREPE